ncbi:MAG: FimV/HubP family polar landmark protein [Pseudomonadales bacterium]
MHVAWRLCGLLLLGCLSGQSWALGLGELDLNSALNERFKANIELFDTGGLESTEIRVSLASSEDFERVGVERFFFLTTLKFDITEVRGKPAIKVSSTQAISEPYLNFLVEVLWPSGRMLKEYTVLLDPPTFTQAAAPDVLAPTRDTASSQVSGAIDRGQVNVPAPRASSGRSAPSSSSASRTGGVNSDGTYGATNRSDTLWKIASDTLPADDVTVQQNMLAIKRLNPEAFIRDNINLLKAGYVLRTASSSDAKELTVGEAQQRVVQENEAWRTGRSIPEAAAQLAEAAEPALKAQVDATEAAEAPVGPAESPEGQLRIVAEAGDSAQGATDPGVEGEGGAAALEERDRLSRELEELTYKMDRELELASDQVTVKERQLEVKDQEIAELQAQVTRMRDEMQRLTAERAQNQSAPSDSQAAWWQSPMVLGGGLGALVLLSVGGLLVARKRRADEEAEYYAHEMATEAELATGERAEPYVAVAAEADSDALEEEATSLADDLAESDWDAQSDEADEGTETDLSTATGSFDDELSLDDEQPSYTDDAEVGLAENAAGELQEGQISDVIGESEIYIAYGRFPQAVNLLTGALTQDPDRHDVRCKLLELYAEMNERDNFNSEMETLVQRCDDEDVLTAARDLEGRLEEVAADIALANDAEEAETEEAEDDNGFDLSLADDSDDNTVDFSNVDDSVAEASDDFELEIDDLDQTDATAPIAESTALSEAEDEIAELYTEDTESGSGDQLGGDLGLDFDPDRDVDSQTDVAAAANDDDDLLDLDALLDDNGDTEGESASLDLGGVEDEFDFADSEDGTSTKLDLAKAYIDMGDEDGARDILNEVLTEGSETQQKQAQELLENI